MEYLPAVGAGIVVAAVATMLKYFFELLDWEHKRFELRVHRDHPTHHRWLHAPPRRAQSFRTRELVHR